MQKHLEGECKRVRIYTVIKGKVESVARREAKEKGRIEGVWGKIIAFVRVSADI